MILSVLEGGQHDQQTKDMAAALFHKELDLVEARLQRGVAEGELAEDFDCRAVAAIIAAASSGIMVLAMADYPREALEGIGHTSLGHLAQD